MNDVQTIIGGQLPIAFVVVAILDWLKRATWFKWMTDQTEKINHIVSIVVAFGSATGIMVITGDSSHGWNIAIAGVPILLGAAKHIVLQYCFQEGWHKAVYGNHNLGKAQLAETQELKQKVAELQGLMAPKA